MTSGKLPEGNKLLIIFLKGRDMIKKEIITFNKKIDTIISYVMKEYEDIISIYNTNNLYKKCISLKPTKKCDEKEKEFVQKSLDEFFMPYLKIMTDIIDNGLVDFDSIIDELILSEPNMKKLMEQLINKSLDKLYFYMYIRYNITLSFIMQIYLIFEKEFVEFSIKVFSTSSRTILNLISKIEKTYNLKIDDNIIKLLNKYRLIININKYGYGTSYEELKKFKQIYF